MEEMPGNNVVDGNNGATPGGDGSSSSSNSATLSWSKILKNSQNKNVMEGFFNKICTSYENVDSCLAECEARSNSGVNIRQTYAGLKFICKDIRED
uniref:Uncharacterized protein n=1 Tax=Panagrolaimus superbus TaxID=310955 RepID=A0A914YAZ5_9BILA